MYSEESRKKKNLHNILTFHKKILCDWLLLIITDKKVVSSD